MIVITSFSLQVTPSSGDIHSVSGEVEFRSSTSAANLPFGNRTGAAICPGILVAVMWIAKCRRFFNPPVLTAGEYGLSS